MVKTSQRARNVGNSSQKKTQGQFAEGFAGKTVLITGHTGFKGSWLAFWLQKLGAKVIGIGLDPTTQPSLFNTLDLRSKIEDFRLDIRDSKRIDQVICTTRPDYVFHLAAQSLVNISFNNPTYTWETNVIGTLNILESLRKLDSGCVAVMITSDKCYKNVEQSMGYKETDELGGFDPYSASKGAAEFVIRSYVKSFFSQPSNEIQIASARAGNVIGGGDWADKRIIPDCMKSWALNEPVVLRNPNSTRPWQHVLEPLSGYMTLALALKSNPDLHGEAFNFGPNLKEDYSVSSLVDEVASHWDRAKWTTDSSTESAYYESNLLKLECEKASRLLKWSSVFNFSETSKFTAEWYKQYYCDASVMAETTLSQIEIYEKYAHLRGLNWAM